MDGWLVGWSSRFNWLLLFAHSIGTCRADRLHGAIVVWSVGPLLGVVVFVGVFVKAMARLLMACMRSFWLNKDILAFSLASKYFIFLYCMLSLNIYLWICNLFSSSRWFYLVMSLKPWTNFSLQSNITLASTLYTKLFFLQTLVFPTRLLLAKLAEVPKGWL